MDKASVTSPIDSLKKGFEEWVRRFYSLLAFHL